MNRLVLTVGIFCLLQGIWARPDFGVVPTIPISATVKLAFDDSFAEVTDIVNVTLSATFTIQNTNLQATYKAIKNVVNQTNTLSGTFDYKSLFTLTNGTDGAFAKVIKPIDDMVTYITVTSKTDIITPLNTTTGYTGIVDELVDEFGRLALGLGDVKKELLAVKAALDSAVLANNNNTAISATQLATYLKATAVYKLVRAINRVKAYLPVITYTLDTVNENLIEAVAFITELQADINAVTTSNATDYSGAYNVSATAVELKASTGVSTSLGLVGTAKTNLTASTSFSATNGSTAILGALGTLATKNTASAAALLHTEFNTTLYAIKDLVKSNVQTANVTADPNIQTLIDVLMGNNKGFGRYCYHKYKDLFAGLFDNGVEGGFECTDKEAERLRNLQSIIAGLLVQIDYDTEDLLVQINTCTSLPATQASACVAAVVDYYVALYPATAQKIDALYTFVTKEAVASRNRLLICFQVVYYQQGTADAATLANNVKICAKDGPAGTLE